MRLKSQIQVRHYEKHKLQLFFISVFRTLSGRCNNLAFPSLGRHTVPFARLLPAEYDGELKEARHR